MFSRLASGAGSTKLLCRIPQQFTLAAQPTASSSTAVKRFTPADPESTKRDLINFPRPAQLDRNPPTRHGFIPESWFEFFYKKTGVTGPYAFGIGLATFLCGKEYYVFEHEFVTALGLIIIATTVQLNFGPQIQEFLEKGLQEREKLVNSKQEAAKQELRNQIKSAELNVKWNEGSVLVFDVKKENVLLQQEAAYRERLLLAYKEVKRRLDYQIEKQNVERQIAQKNLVDWVVRNVVKSITPDQEKNALKQCIADLNGLAARA